MRGIISGRKIKLTHCLTTLVNHQKTELVNLRNRKIKIVHKLSW